MGRSTTSCFKIISCGGSNESVDIDASSENKGPDKRGWSFRKRSARHRVLSNTVVTEIPSSENKESSEPVTINSEAQVNSTISEKTSGNQWTEEMPRLSNSITKDATVSTMATKAACEDVIKCESDPDESAILVIQAAVRRFLAQRQLLRHKNVVKLQAAVRGHLVRNHAVGTLRCVQAIVKMQALVRARRANLSAEGSSVGEKGVQKPGTNSHATYISIEKLLSNRLARQLLESTPRTKQINIKCDPSKSDSAWNWLERWMSVSSPDTVESHAPEQDQDKVNNAENQVETVIPSHCESTYMKSNVGEATVTSEGKENLINTEQNSYVRNHEEEKPQPANTYIPDSMEKPQPANTYIPDSMEKPQPANTYVPDSMEKPQPANTYIPDSMEKPQPANTHVPDSMEKPNSLPDEPMHLNTGTQIEVTSIPEKPVSETEPKRPAKRLATDQADSEGRKSVFGSRKASNPAFIAAQSRFEELTSKSNSLKSVNSSNLDSEAGLSADISSSAPENATQTTDVEPEEYLVSHSSRLVPNGGSECGTELSITSTLDSPDQSEVGNKKFDEEAKVLDEAVGDMNSNNNIDVEEHAFSSSKKTDSDLVMPEKHDSGDGAETEKLKPANNVAISQLDQNLVDSASDADIELEPESGHQVYKSNAHMELELEHETVHQEYKSSAEASPRSHITVPESQGTPSSQLSTNTKKTRSDKKVSSQKRKSWSTSKKSPVSSSLDSGLRSSLEQLPKDPKPGKRRNSFGSPRPDHIDQEPRDSSSNSSLPSYMQATESARAKAVANSSPRSSPDVQDKEIYLKKRHSLPGAVNGRQSSPRIQRSMSQALQSTKGNGNQDRKWQR